MKPTCRFRVTVMNYLQFNDRGKFEPEEQALANYFGEGNYVGFYKKHFLRDKFQITKDDFIAGDIDVMFHAMRRLGIEYSYNDYPECLKPYLHRKVWEDKLGNIRKELFNEGFFKSPIFIKPKNRLKRFTGFVLESVDDLHNCKGVSGQMKVWCSEPVTFIDEFRCYFNKDNKPVMGCYKEDFDEKNKIKVQQFLSSLILGRELPSAFALDLGVLSTGEVALIEMNDAFSIGKYNGIDDETYAKLVITRWDELKRGIA